MEIVCSKVFTIGIGLKMAGGLNFENQKLTNVDVV